MYYALTDCCILLKFQTNYTEKKLCFSESQLQICEEYLFSSKEDEIHNTLFNIMLHDVKGIFSVIL